MSYFESVSGKISGRKLVTMLIAVMVVGLVFQVFSTLRVHALNVRTEIKSMPPGMANIVDKSGRIPVGVVNPKGNRPTALTINTDILFGNVFPGETRQGEFKVMLSDTDPQPGGFGSAYTRVEYHLIIAGKTGYLDLAPLLSVVRDTAETDIEPDAVGAASLDSSTSDTSDRWVVTLNLPDSPASGDYWTTITVWVDSTTP